MGHLTFHESTLIHDGHGGFIHSNHLPLAMYRALAEYEMYVRLVFLSSRNLELDEKECHSSVTGWKFTGDPDGWEGDRGGQDTLPPGMEVIV